MVAKFDMPYFVRHYSPPFALRAVSTRCFFFLCVAQSMLLGRSTSEIFGTHRTLMSMHINLHFQLLSPVMNFALCIDIIPTTIYNVEHGFTRGLFTV